MKSFEFNPRKFREAMVFFAENGKDDFWFGSTRLAKQLFFLDFYSYANFGDPVTGATYMHKPRGPVPRQLLIERDQLAASGRLAIEDNVLAPGRVQKRPVASDPPDMSVFDEFETNLLHAVAGMFRNENGIGRKRMDTSLCWLEANSRRRRNSVLHGVCGR